MKELVGVIGMGDLGVQLAEQIRKSGREVVAFDTNGQHSSKDVVLENCSVIHWTAPAKSLELDELRDKLVILHDSSMTNSWLAITSRDDIDNFAIVHCLMNDAKRVFIADSMQKASRAFEHFKSIGMSPKLASIQEHEFIIARSQGVLASLIATGLKDQLDAIAANDDLTPSGQELHQLLINREANWTRNSLDSILSNPVLKQFYDDLLGILR